MRTRCADRAIRRAAHNGWWLGRVATPPAHKRWNHDSVVESEAAATQTEPMARPMTDILQKTFVTMGALVCLWVGPNTSLPLSQR